MCFPVGSHIAFYYYTLRSPHNTVFFNLICCNLAGSGKNVVDWCRAHPWRDLLPPHKCTGASSSHSSSLYLTKSIYCYWVSFLFQVCLRLAVSNVVGKDQVLRPILGGTRTHTHTHTVDFGAHCMHTTKHGDYSIRPSSSIDRKAEYWICGYP